MSSGVNKAILVGNLGMDPELKFTQGGQAVLRMRIATSESWMKDGEKKESTEWHTAIVWGKRAEGLNKCLKKGSRLYLEGRIQTRAWEDKDGGKRYATEISVQNVVLLGDAGGGAQRGASPGCDEAPSSYGGGCIYGADETDEIIPF